MEPAKPTLSICMTCRDSREGACDTRGGSRLARRVAEKLARDSDAQMRLRGVQCMSQCKRSCIVSLAAEGRFTYVFGELDPDNDIHVDALFELVSQYLKAPEGFLERKDRPAPLQASVLDRLPPLDPQSPLVSNLSLAETWKMSPRISLFPEVPTPG